MYGVLLLIVVKFIELLLKQVKYYIIYFLEKGNNITASFIDWGNE